MKHKIQENYIITDKLIVNESIFTIGNGYLGVRGNFEEGYGEEIPTIRGTYINAFHDIIPVPYAEKAYGFPETMQRQLNVIDSQTLIIELEDGEVVSPISGMVSDYYRSLHMKEGYLIRSFVYKNKKGQELKITYKRMASFQQLELFLIDLEIEPISYFGKVKVTSLLNGDVHNFTDDNDPRVASDFSKLLHVFHVSTEDDKVTLAAKTTNSQMICACSSSLECSLTSGGFQRSVSKHENQVKEIYEFILEKKVELTKYIIYTDTLRHENPIEDGIHLLSVCKEGAFKVWMEKQESYLEKFWENTYIDIQGESSLQEGLQFNIFQLLQSVGKDKFSNIAAKGLTGEGYEGHYFWDTEIFIFPVFLLTNQELARNLLMYRYNILEHAKDRAREMGHKQGALYPWRTISGTECSSYFPAGSAQYHISGDVAYAFISYYIATLDLDFMLDYGAEMLFETARLWMDVGHEKNHRFYIDCVTGPDEYTAIVNNNYYTNAVAKYNLDWAYKVYKKLLVGYEKTRVESLLDRLGLTEEEILCFKKTSDKMYLPYDEKLGLNPQDDGFLNKKRWDFEGTREEEYPLLMNFHPLTIYRHQVLKQADTVLAHLLLEDYSDFDTIKNSYDYYEPLTTHDSSLSCCVTSMMACKLGYKKAAYDYFMETARLDLDNTHNNTKDGLHMANMGGSFMGIVFGFAGLRMKEDGIHFNPILSEKWDGYQFNIHFRGRVIHLTVNVSTISIRLDGKPFMVYIYDKGYQLEDTITLPLKK